MTREVVIRKVTAYVVASYAGDWKLAFDGQDMDHDGRISLAELELFLYSAKVGFSLTRWAVAKAIIEELDTNGDGFVAWAEFETVFRAQTTA